MKLVRFSGRTTYLHMYLIEEMGKNFVVDVNKDLYVYLSDPQPYLPEPLAKKGRKPTRMKADSEAIEVEQYIQSLTNKDFKEVKLRKGTKDWVMVKVHSARVRVWDGKEQTARERTLIIRKSVKKKEPVKFASSNIGVRGTRHSHCSGLALAIVKKIAELNHWQVTYAFENNEHTFSVTFH